MADNETPAAPEEQPQTAEESTDGGAPSRQRTSDSWVMVEDPEGASQPAETSEPQEQPKDEAEPEKPTEPEAEPEKPAEPEAEPEKPAEPEEKPAEPEAEAEKPAEPEATPEEEKPAEPELEPEKPAEPEEKPAEAEPEPEKPAEPEAEAEKPAEPEAEAEKPAEPESEEKQPEEAKKEGEPTAEAEQPKEEDKPAEQEQPAAAAAVEGEKSGESRDSVTVEVTVDVSGTTPAPEEPKEELPEPGEEIHYGQYLRQLKVGSDLIKVKKSKVFPRIYRLEDDLQWVSWNSHNKKAIKARIGVSSITEVRIGRNTDSFKISNSTHSQELCFSIIYIDGKDSRTLDLAAVTEDDRKAWVEGLRALIREKEDKFSSKVRDKWLRDLFDQADKNGDGTLDLKEVLQMMKSLNVGVSKKVVKKMFKDADADGECDGKLSFEEFCSLFKELASRPELRRLFYLYSSKMEWWTLLDLQRFLHTEQGADNPSIELCTQIIQRYETTAQGKEENMMSLDGFTQFMLGPESDIFNVDHRSVYQDMSQPLSFYFIASSHNTYLLEDQLKGPSSCEAYINALKRGCRCVELDCWDGPDGEPIIYHGHTLTSKILFKDVIQVIKDYAFQASPFPVILSIENHCSIPQQNRMADIMNEIFGDMLFKAARDEDAVHLPSPNDLKYKILIKGKKLPKAVEVDDDDGEVSDEDEAAELDPEELAKIQPEPEESATTASGEEPKAEAKPEPSADKEGEGDKPKEPEASEQPKEEETPKENGQPKAEEAEKPKEGGEEEQAKTEVTEQPKEGDEATAASAEGATAAEGEGEKKEEKKEGAEASGDGTLAPPTGSPSKADRVKRVLSFRSRPKKSPVASGQSARPAKKIKLSAKLSALINYVQSVHFKGFEDLESGKCYQMSSFGESSASKFSSSQASKYVQYNRRQISRTYPAGTRVTSTNYDPIPMWNAGCQIVALNYQTEGRPMDFNDGRFRDNGGSGYILKPDYMRKELSRFDHNQRSNIGGLVSKVLTIKVISGQQLPKPGGNKKGEIIDPYVKIQIGGIGEDSQAVKTKVVSDNGFNPVWNEVFQFVIRNQDLALVRFKVMDKDVNEDDFIGSFCLPLSSVVPGYRHIHLTYAGYRDERIGNATLFVHITMQDYVAHKGGHKSRTALKVKKSRDYPEHALVGHQPIDLLFRNVSGPLHRVVDLKEDLAFALLHYKELCGYGGQADVGECLELFAERVSAAKLKLNINSVKKGDSAEVYQAVVVATEEGKSVSVPHTLHQLAEAFNQLNLVIKEVLDHALNLSHELENIYKEAEQMKDGLKTHLRETATPPKRFDQVLDHYCRTMHSVNAESEEAVELKKRAEKVLKRIAAGAQEAKIEINAAST